MVQLHIKKGDESAFLYQISVATSLSELVPKVATLYNDRRRLERLISATQDLLKYGPEKPENEKGYSEDQLEEIAKNQGEPSGSRKAIQKNGFTFYEVTCPTGTRVGLAAGEDAIGVVQPTLDASAKLISKDTIKSGFYLEEGLMKGAFEHIQAALTIIYPEGLPKWDPSRAAIEDDEDLEGSAASKDVHKIDESVLWWAGKELAKDKTLSDYVGKNEKTKIVVKLQKKGQGPPVKEAPISEAEQKNMMAYYYRKQEELKKLGENDEDEYLNSSWADPKSLKRAFTGVGNSIKF